MNLFSPSNRIITFSLFNLWKSKNSTKIFKNLNLHKNSVHFGKFWRCELKSKSFFPGQFKK